MVEHINKQRQRDGIYCDLCGSLHVNKFCYYSAKFHKIEVDCDAYKSVVVQGKSMKYIKDVVLRDLDLDICENCMDKMKDTVLKHIEIRERKKDSPPGKGKVIWTTKT